MAELQEALLPTALPVLPRVRIAARYLVAGQEQAAGGDWFDAIPLDGGAVALVVGDVVGHGLSASAAMGQLRAVLAELLAAEDDLGRVLRRTDAFAARMPSLRAATLVLVVLDPAAGTLRYTTCGHPPPLVIGVDGKARYLEGTGNGPFGTGSPPVLASSALAPDELVLLYSDGLIERPDQTIAEGMAELAVVATDAADAAADRRARRGSGRGGAGLPAERGGADPHRTHRRHHRAGRPVARRSCPPAAAGAAQRAVQPDHGAGRLRRLAEQARRDGRRRRRAAPGHGGDGHQRHRARLSPGGAGDHRARREPGQRRQRDVPDHRPRHLAAARPGRRGPRPRPDGGRARRGQAAGQPPGRAPRARGRQ